MVDARIEMLRTAEILGKAGSPPERICGIYFLIRKDEIVYVGSSQNIIPRVFAHAENKDFDSVSVQRCDPAILEQLAGEYIARDTPIYNTRFPLGSRYKSKPQLKRHCVDGYEVNRAIRTGGLSAVLVDGRKHYVESEFLEALARCRADRARGR